MEVNFPIYADVLNCYLFVVGTHRATTMKFGDSLDDLARGFPDVDRFAVAQFDESVGYPGDPENLVGIDDESFAL